MKPRFALFLLILTLGLSVYGAITHPIGLVEAAVKADVPKDEGGDGFAVDDPCGFLMGESVGNVSGTTTYYGVQATAVSPKRLQACADASHNFYSTPSGTRDSRLLLKNPSNATAYTLDLANSTAETSVSMIEEGDYASWYGFARITDASFKGNRWVWFDWDCSKYTGSATGVASKGASACPDASRYHVRTYLKSGITEGYAWNDTLGFIAFTSSVKTKFLTLELPPEKIHIDVDVLDSNGDTPHKADAITAPLADGYDYWRIRVRFYGSDGAPLVEDDVESLEISPLATARSKVYLDQVDNKGDAILLQSWNPAFGCTSTTASYCSITENNIWSANYFVYSGAPTSNMVGENIDSDPDVDVLTDRDGCRAIYSDQLAAGAPACAGVTSANDEKSEVFNERTSERNYYELESVQLDVEFHLFHEAVVVETSNLVKDGTSYVAYPSTTWPLSFRPRYQLSKFSANYGGKDHDQIPKSETPDLTLAIKGVVADASPEYVKAQRISRPAYVATYQMDIDSSNDPALATDKLFLIDGDGLAGADCTARQIKQPFAYSSKIFSSSFEMNYGVRKTSCGGAVGASTNTYKNPTVEQWVCDNVSTARYTAPSCYYTGYLSLQDRHADPLPMQAIGAVSSNLNQAGILDNNDSLSVLASPDSIALRNAMYAQVLRYVGGRTAKGGTLDSEMNPSKDILSLMDGDLLFAHGDTVVTGSSGFTDRTLVVLGGNVYLKGDITDGRLGVVAFKENGVGGNVYVAPSVTELNANFFLDGAFYSYNGTDTYTDEPSWTDDEDRLDALNNQLYLNGSLLSRNTIGAAEDPSASSWDLGDGTTTTSYKVAREHDLNQVRQYRLCYPLDEFGNVDQTQDPGPCNEGEKLSSYGESATVYSTFIFEYAPSDGLPIFWEESSLFP